MVGGTIQREAQIAIFKGLDQRTNIIRAKDGYRKWHKDPNNWWPDDNWPAPLESCPTILVHTWQKVGTVTARCEATEQCKS